MPSEMSVARLFFTTFHFWLVRRRLLGALMGIVRQRRTFRTGTACGRRLLDTLIEPRRADPAEPSNALATP